jgi:protoheme IX farnesyltransferase
MERQHDAQMRRTARRPVVIGTISPSAAFVFGVVVSLAGILYLGLAVNRLSSFIAGLTLVGYLALYTPLKRLTPMCTFVGAVPGAAPPLIGWAAASGSLGPEAWNLYLILFLWQFPHLMAIAWMYRDDYDRAGYRVLPRCKRRRNFVAFQCLMPAILLVPISVMPALVGDAGHIYLWGATSLGLGFLCVAGRLAFNRGNIAARQLLFASIIYLPAVFVLLLLDRT